MRQSFPLALCGICLSLGFGCSHLTESRVVDAFTESLKEHDAARLAQQSSSEFEEKALRGEETFETLKLIDLPEGKPKVVKVIDKREDDEEDSAVVEKRVIVEYGDKQTGTKKVCYRLKRDGEGGKWVVDDLYLSKADEKINKSLGTRMEAFHSLLESLEAWKGGRRDQILTTATPEFARALNELSPAHLQRFSKQITEDVPEQVRILSQDRIGDETAELRIARGTQSELEFQFRRVDGRWKLDDLKVESRRSGGGVESARQVTSAMSAALAFQQAYHNSDKQRLETVTTEQFFNGSLAAADLTQVKLPGTTDGHEDFEVRLERNTASFIVTAEPQIMKISLTRQAKGQIHEAPQYLVDDVTIYELDNTQDKRLSALFTSHATMNAFAAALADRDLKAVRASSTHDFNHRVWSHVKPDNLSRLPLRELQPAAPRIVQTAFKGPLTEVLVEQGDTPLTYVLRDEGGRMLVDDVLIPATTRPESLKVNVELALPIVRFTIALEKSIIEDVRGVTSEEFQRLEWNNYKQTPPFLHDPFPHLRAPLHAIRVSGDRAVVVLGNARFGAEVKLEKERGEFRVDEVVLVSESKDAPRLSMRRAIDKQFARSGQPSFPLADRETSH